MGTLARVFGPAYTPQSVMSMADRSLSEGNTGQTSMVFTVQLSAAQPFPIRYSYQTEDVTAVGGVDYVSQAGTTTIPIGQTSATISVPIIGDSDEESDETFSVRLFNIEWVLN